MVSHVKNSDREFSIVNHQTNIDALSMIGYRIFVLKLVHFPKGTSVKNILEPFTLTAIKNIMDDNKV